MTPHTWVRDPPEEWRPLAGKMAERHPGWKDAYFECSVCGCIGHAMAPPEGPPPDLPEEVRNPFTKSLVDVGSDCKEQVVEGVHGI